MKTIEIIGYKRANLGKSEAKKLRAEGNVPCVLYGGDEQVHFYAPMILFRELVYTDEAHFVHLNIEGQEYEAIMQDLQFHPVSEVILHVDFLQLFKGKLIKMNIPVHFEGTSIGAEKGGTLIKKRRYLKIQSLPKDMPEYVSVDITPLDFGKAIKVGDIEENNFTILDSKISSVAVVEMPRALRGKSADEEEELEEEGAEAEAEGEGPAEGGDA
ncbi:50S ribosomal protein L25/general stress protein Ctc [Fulvivirga sp. RKSG066]|uniref:50S ribosomal protein L25/general stress protein Ctc n=1 Tax=Fulvivirga aurantia TaxID=2529383 RepID=UPI0012BC4C79|nr:50S ribosomal protein L25/general stress protein Ctc [Fulvivirga aurantia]MTI22853.1 50S ribosomal protein L25/general stress protein Ctc [Fulvivirga aurantia]